MRDAETSLRASLAYIRLVHVPRREPLAAEATVTQHRLSAGAGTVDRRAKPLAGLLGRQVDHISQLPLRFGRAGPDDVQPADECTGFPPSESDIPSGVSPESRLSGQ